MVTTSNYDYQSKKMPRDTGTEEQCPGKARGLTYSHVWSVKQESIVTTYYAQQSSGLMDNNRLCNSTPEGQQDSPQTPDPRQIKQGEPLSHNESRKPR